jgi:hypothetical protein
VPLVAPAGIGATVAVNVTTWPATARFGDTVRAVVVGVFVIISVNGGEVDVVKVALPE